MIIHNWIESRKRDSNPHLTGLKPDVSASWTTPRGVNWPIGQLANWLFFIL